MASICGWHFVLIWTVFINSGTVNNLLNGSLFFIQNIPLFPRIVVNRSSTGEIKLFQQQADFSSFSKGISFIPMASIFVLCLESCVIYTCILVQIDVAFFVVIVDFGFSIFHFSMFAKAKNILFLLFLYLWVSIIKSMFSFKERILVAISYFSFWK